MNPLQAAMESVGIRSFDALARQLCATYPDTDWPQARSLGTRLGQLNKGELKWWAKRPELVAKLVELVSCAPEDLGIHAKANRVGLFRFDDFPELPPLDLASELPCDLGSFRNQTATTEDPNNGIMPWFGVQSPGPRGSVKPENVLWLHFPPGTGRSLFWARLRARSPYECKTALSVASEVERLKRPEPICLNVTDSQGDRDVLALTERNPDCAVLICAPFGPPERETARELEHLSWRYLESPDHLQRWFDITNPNASQWSGGIARYRWTLHPNWRSRLLSWVDRRLSHADSFFHAGEVESWIGCFEDPELFDTPQSLIAICRFAHYHGCRHLPGHNEPHTGLRLLELLNNITPVPREQLRLLIEMLLFDLTTPWNDWIPAPTWTRIVSASAQGAARRELLDKLVTEKDETKREALARQLSQLDGPSYQIAIDSDVLQQNERGDVRLQPRFIVELIARDHLSSIIRTDSHNNWGHLYFDTARRSTIDSAVNLLSLTDLEGAASRLIDSNEEDVSAIGAAEALFCAVGRRKLFAQELPPALLEVMTLVSKRLREVNPCRPDPFTSVQNDHSLWQGICWTWSLIAPAPENIPPDWSAYFPGWFKHSADISWHMLSVRILEDCQIEHLSATDRFLLERAELVSAALPDVTDELPEVLIPFMLTKRVEAGDCPPPPWWQLSLEKTWAQELLIKRFEGMQQPLTPWLVSAVEAIHSMPTSSEGGQEGKSLFTILNTFLLRPRLSKVLFERSDPAAFCDNLSWDVVRSIFANCFTMLPNRYQAAVLERIRTHST